MMNVSDQQPPTEHPSSPAPEHPQTGSGGPHRRRRIWAGVLGVIAVIVIAAVIWGPSVYRDVFVGQAADNPVEELQSQSGDSGETATSVAAGTWILASGSYAGYRVNEVLRGEDVTVTARTEQISGSATTSETQLTAAEISVDIASIASDADQRDKYFRSSAIDASDHPTATFTLTQPVDIADAVGNAVSSVQLVGDLTMNGVTAQVTVDAAVASDASGVRVAGQIPITFADFDVEAPSLGFVSVEDQGYVEFSTVLTRAS